MKKTQVIHRVNTSNMYMKKCIKSGQGDGNKEQLLQLFFFHKNDNYYCVEDVTTFLPLLVVV